jgi:hypothetical protein
MNIVFMAILLNIAHGWRFVTPEAMVQLPAARGKIGESTVRGLDLFTRRTDDACS